MGMKLIVVALLASTLQVSDLQDTLAKGPVNSPPGLNRLSSESGNTLEVIWNESTQTPAVLMGMLSRPSDHSPGWIANTFVQRNKKLYGLRYPDQDMKISGVVKQPGNLTEVRFQLFLYNTPVWENGLSVYIDERGVVRRTEGNVHYDLRKTTFHRSKQAAVSEQEAIATAKATLQNPGIDVKATTVQKYYLPTLPGIPLVYVVTLLLDDERKEQVMISALLNRVIRET
ncbi:MAG: hypothetical protein K0Q73_8405 [Paenibacillus sp.]|nr:hypothetical protein [Paenibacillus sp.]